MRLSIELFGYELSFGPAGEPESEFDEYQDAGYTGSTQIGFSLPVVPFGEMDCPPHQYDPDDC